MSSMWIKKLKRLKRKKKKKSLEDFLGPETIKKIKSGAIKLTPETMGIEVQNNLMAHIFAINVIINETIDYEETLELTDKIIDIFEGKDYATIFVVLDYLNYYFNGLLRERIKEKGQEDFFRDAVCEYAKLSRLDKILGFNLVSKDREKEFNQMFG